MINLAKIENHMLIRKITYADRKVSGFFFFCDVIYCIDF